MHRSATFAGFHAASRSGALFGMRSHDSHIAGMSHVDKHKLCRGADTSSAHAPPATLPRSIGKTQALTELGVAANN